MPLFDHFRRAISARDSQANVDPHAWRLPSAYSASKPGTKQTVIPNPRIFAGSLIPRQAQTGSPEVALAYPDIGHAAVHLALLECFWNLRIGASSLDVEVSQPPAYDEKPRTAQGTEPAKLPKPQRWELLIELAVARFAAWWSSIDDVLRHATAYAHHGSDKFAVQLSKNHLPPLDVLLVWYAFMLDNDDYRQCTSDRDHIQHLCFPWPAIREVIDMDKMQFSLPKSAQALFTTMSSQSADIMQYLENPPAYSDPISLPFGLDLVAEVRKSERFIDEAHTMLWIRAPSIHGSLFRASRDYLEFQTTRTASEQDETNPPFGIELILRTHRLFPSQYELFLDYMGLRNPTGSPKGLILQRHSSEPETADQGMDYDKCYCWTCERIRDDLPTFVHRQSQPASSSSSSASPSTVTNGQLSSLSADQIRQIQDDLGFYNAVHDARNRGKPLPTRPPTVAEKQAEKTARERQKEAGYLPGLNECIEILPDGTRKIRRQKYVTPFGNLVMV